MNNELTGVCPTLSSLLQDFATAMLCKCPACTGTNLEHGDVAEYCRAVSPELLASVMKTIREQMMLPCAHEEWRLGTA